ncbi:AMP-dependent synthetase/ligase [Hufsiella ginkgonis]|uniref:AMP-binding protein n=1 Tax=Hufsiella ginkgonis TaxID=2695274 RepID=A0A7K1Y5D8_9SPHI|nr:long-chain fatty acid--CoA ligase [Hufsiella ginkgonis]MXV17916.1 AMP-binding protein [Hufsiella ginkgonis]
MTTISRIFDLTDQLPVKFPGQTIVSGKANGSWYSYTSEQFVEITELFSRGLIASGIAHGDKVAILSQNRPEWNICDFGVMQTGAALVPMYPTLADHDIRFILKDAEVKMIFISGTDLLRKIIALNDNERLKIYSLDKLEGVAHWQELVGLGREHPEIDLQKIKDGTTPDDLLTLIYTSGTTGTPKGVMLTHKNLLSNVLSSCVLYPSGYAKALSFLPLCHIFERMVVYMYFNLGISIFYAESMDTIVADLNDVKPDGFTTVPRLLEKVYDRIAAKGAALTGIKKKLFYWALDLGLRYELDGKNGWWYELQLAIANKLVFSKWREALGGKIQAIISGGAALQPRLARVFWAAGIPVLEGYGLTETSPVIAVNGLEKGKRAFNTVGKPISNVIVKIGDDGEVLCKAPSVMKGYYKRPDLTAEVIDADGFFHTGDIGQLNGEGFLSITDRKKEMFKTAGGKYVAPQIIENKFKESPLIEQVMVIGENRKFPAALIVPAFDALKDWCSKKNIPWSTRAEVICNPLVTDKYKRELDRYNEEFGHWEQVKKFALLPQEWTIEQGEMTPKLSLKRKVVTEKHRDIIEELYRDVTR